MNTHDIIKKTVYYVKNLHAADHGGHDWSHIERVFNLATTIAQAEGADIFVVQMAALLHDIEDPKLRRCPNQTYNKNINYLMTLGITADQIVAISIAIDEVSFSKNKDKKPSSLESCVVQDADRLDAIGAIGIARCFAYGGSKGRAIYDSRDLVKVSTSENQSTHKPESSIYHFYEKLLLVRDHMNTRTGKDLAFGRHAFLEKFLDQFFQEWNGKL